jgi:Immunity protein Imm1
MAQDLPSSRSPAARSSRRVVRTFPRVRVASLNMDLTTIRDLEEPTSVINATVRSVDDALLLLEAVPDRPPFFCLLESSKHALLVGVGHGFGCAQYSSRERQPPYLMAVAPQPAVTAEFCRFLSGGQISEVPSRYCLTWRELRQAVSFFVTNPGEREPTLHWEEI